MHQSQAFQVNEGLQKKVVGKSDRSFATSCIEECFGRAGKMPDSRINCPPNGLSILMIEWTRIIQNIKANLARSIEVDLFSLFLTLKSLLEFLIVEKQLINE